MLPIRRRVIALGIPLGLAAFWLVVRMEQTDQTGLPTGLALYYHVVAALLLLAAGNALLRRFAPGAILTQAELLCLFSMMAVASSFASWEMLGTHLQAIAYPVYWQATTPDRNPAVSVALRELPSWALLRDPESARQLFHGRRPWQPEALAGWWLPLAVWGGLLAVTQAMAAAGCRLLYGRWAHDEKLSFPLTALPLEIADPEGRLWTRQLFWIGFALTVLLDLMNGLHELYPTVPSLNVKVHWFNQGASSSAWQTVGGWPVTFHPLVAGLAFLLPTDLLFSCWFFYLVSKLQLYLAGAQGIAEGSRWQFGGNVPGLIEQNAGAFLVLGITALWGARGHLAAVWRALENGDAAARRDGWVLAVGTSLWTAALLWLGLPWILVPPFLLLAALLAVVVTRLRAEMGLPVHNLHGQGPEMLLGSALGPTALGSGALSGLMAMHGLLRSQQGHAMPHQMEGAFLADRARAPMRRYWSAVTLAGACAALVGPWIFVRTASGEGLMQSGYNPFPSQAWAQLAAWQARPVAPDLRALGLMAAGALVTTSLIALRAAWVGSPFHPLGYAISGGWGLGMIATPLFLAWVAKTLILRYGGLSAYRRAIPFAFGLILGEFLAGTFWTLLGILLDQPTYRVWLF